MDYEATNSVAIRHVDPDAGNDTQLFDLCSNEKNNYKTFTGVYLFLPPACWLNQAIAREVSAVNQLGIEVILGYIFDLTAIG
uniref:Uncharacterized protein n=1 Tax=Brassica campestris TaxID=3711 RepID=M4FCF1_BRACM